MNAQSVFQYPDSYKGSKSIKEQIRILGDAFGLSIHDAMDYAHNLEDISSQGSEGYFAFMSPFAWQDSTTDFYNQAYAELYCVSLRILFGFASKFYVDGFHNWEGLSNRLHQSTRSLQLFDYLKRNQKGGIWIVGAQLGGKNIGVSPSEVESSLPAYEFGMSSIIGSSIAITHPERFAPDSLGMFLSGDELRADMGNDFSFTPAILHSPQFNNSILYMGYPNTSQDDGFGVATVFLPKQK